MRSERLGGVGDSQPILWSNQASHVWRSGEDAQRTRDSGLRTQCLDGGAAQSRDRIKSIFVSVEALQCAEIPLGRTIEACGWGCVERSSNEAVMTSSGAARGKRERKLPVQQLAILGMSICRFAEPLATTSVFPYLPEMIRSFGVPSAQVGKWAGLCAAVFSLCQAVMGIPWGRASDRYGRKPAILLGQCVTMLTSLLWGFSTSLAMAIAARAIAGAGNGNVGIIRTTVAEMVPFRELQPRAFSIMPLVWNIGSIFGPVIGGALANPLNVKPGERTSSGAFLERFPYAIPNIVSAIFFSFGITFGVLFLQETLETKRDKRDWGLVVGHRILTFGKSHVLKAREILRLRRPTGENERREESQPLIKRVDDDEEAAPAPSSKKASKTLPPAPPWSQVLNRQAILNLIVYTLLAMHTMAYDQVLPVFMSDRPVGRATRADNPLQFSGGFGLDHLRIGLLSTFYGMFGMVVQFFLFPPIARRLGVLYCLKWCSAVFPVAYLLMPFTVLLPTQASQVGACFVIMLIKCTCAIFAFPCSTILLTNSASGLRVLGTLNGIATSTSAIGRALGPASVGAMYTVGAERGYVVAPWWFLAAVGIVAAVPVFALVEGEGFGGDEDDVESEEDEEEEERVREDELRREGLEGESEGVAGKPGPVLVPSRRQVNEEDEEAEHGYGGVGPLDLSRTNTISSEAMTDEGEERSAAGRAPPTGRQASGTGSTPRRSRQISFPIGGQAVARRYSSSLGQSFGSAGGFQGH